MSFQATGYSVRDARIQVITKVSDQTKNSDITIAADSEVVIALEASTPYTWYSGVVTNGDPTADMDITYTIPTGTTGFWNRYNVGAALARSYASEQLLTQNDDNRLWGSYGQLLTSTTAGNLSLAWAQNVSNANGTTMKAGTYLVVTKMVV